MRCGLGRSNGYGTVADHDEVSPGLRTRMVTVLACPWDGEGEGAVAHTQGSAKR